MPMPLDAPPPDALQARIGAINDVLNAASVLVWDSRTMMPAGGAQGRGQQIATLTRVALDMLLHARVAHWPWQHLTGSC